MNSANITFYLSQYNIVPDFSPFTGNVVLTDDGTGNVKIAVWNVDAPQPTLEQLSAITETQIITQQQTFLQSQFFTIQGSLPSTQPNFSLVERMIHYMLTNTLSLPITEEQYVSICQTVFNEWTTLIVPLPPS